VKGANHRMQGWAVSAFRQAAFANFACFLDSASLGGAKGGANDFGRSIIDRRLG